MTRRTRRIGRMVAVAVGSLALLAATMGPSAGDPPPWAQGGGKPHNNPNNLSVPTIMVNGGFEGVTCGTSALPSTLVEPSGTPLTDYEVPGYYYVQGVHTWQAQCYDASTASADAEWGANLIGGDAAMKVGHPIRVELALTSSDTAVQTLNGYDVVKLDTSLDDRDSAYGTLATETPSGSGTYTATAQAFTPMVYEGGGGMTFSIKNVDTGAFAVPAGTTAMAEINATGKVVYGYNFKPTAAGDYLITFTATNVTLTGTNGPTAVTDNSVSVTITVVPGGTTGGGGGHH